MIDFSNISQNRLKKLEAERANQLKNLCIEQVERNPILLELRFNHGYLQVNSLLEGKLGNKFELFFRSFDRHIYLAYLYVPEPFRRQRIGTDMMNTLIMLADKYGYNIELDVDSTFGIPTSDLLSFYQSFGFIRTSPLELTMVRHPRQHYHNKIESHKKKTPH